MLKLYEAAMSPDADISSNGFFMMVLAVDILGATVHIEKELDALYNGLGASFIEHGEVRIQEVKPSHGFQAGTILCSFSIPYTKPDTVNMVAIKGDTS